MEKGILYTNNQKNREFYEEAPQDYCLEQAAIANRQGAGEDENSEVKLALLKPDSSGYMCISLLNELIENQRSHLLKTALRIVPHVTDDDLLQPNDFPELESHPDFRYEEGVLHGFQAAKAALLAETAVQ